MPASATEETNRPAGPPVRPRFLRVPEVAERLGVSKYKVYDLINTAALPAFQLGGKGHTFRIPEDEFEAWLYGEDEA
jgi:excisionase family DNA binding protein